MFARSVRRALARPRWTIAGSAAAVRATCGVAGAAVFGASFGIGSAEIDPFGDHTPGQEVDNRLLLPDDQWVSPLGQRVTLEDEQNPGGVLSPDGEIYATSTSNFLAPTGLTIINVKTGKVLQKLSPFEGTDALQYSPDGKYLWAAEDSPGKNGGSGVIYKFEVGPEGTITDQGSPAAEVDLPAQHHGTLSGEKPNSAVPSSMATSEDGSKLYVVENANNSIAVIDTQTDKLLNEIPVGNAPQDIVIAGNEAYVSEEGGRRAGAHDTTDESDGTAIVSDPSTGTPTTGTVSVVSLSDEKVTGTIPVGLEPEGETLDGSTLFVANSNSESVSIIDTKSNKVVQTFSVTPLPGETGAVPTSVAMPDPHHLLVTAVRDNAIAEFAYGGPRAPVRYQGVMPTDWGPRQVLYDSPLQKVLVANEKGIGARAPQNTPGAYSTGTVDSTLGIFSMPSQSEMSGLTKQVFADNGWNRLEAEETSHPSTQGPPQAIPRRLGEPSPIKHVFLIIKENLPYDRVLGDIGKGNSDPELASYGEPDSPNMHKLANEFTLFDNFYDSSMASAEGHNWIVQAGPNGYLEWEEGVNYPRGYTAEGDDSLAYQPDGFLWSAAERAHKTVRDYGEYMGMRSAPEPTLSSNAGGSNPLPSWQEWNEDAKVLSGKINAPLDVPLDKYTWYSDVQSANKIDDHDYPSNALRIPDQYRVGIWEQEFKQDEKTGQLPNLTIIWIPDDHTGGEPTGAAEVADNDLALGRIVSDVSHSQFWKSSAIFAEEDDSSNGVDHVDGHHGPLWVASPYVKRGAVDSEYFTLLNVDKTIEQILGIKPMNSRDAAAMPMFSAFTNTPNDKPYEVLHNQIPLSLGVPGAEAETAEEEKEIAELDAKEGKTAPDAQKLIEVPADERSVAQAWNVWHENVAEKRLNRRRGGIDTLNPEQLSRRDWYTATGWSKPYPGDKKILKPEEVPGGNHELGELEDE